MERSLFIELIHHTKNALDSINKFAQLSRGKFSDKEFGEFFYRMITKEIEKNDLLLSSFLNYIKSIVPIRKKGTVNTFIEEVLKKYQVQLEKNKTKIFKNFEKDLPETIVPDEPLKCILDFILQYAMASMPPDGSIEFLTKLFVFQEGAEGNQAFFKKNGEYIEISVVFTCYKKPVEQFGKESETPTLQKEVVSDFMLRLVDDIVQRNQGMMKCGVDEAKGKRFIALKFPVEKRKVFLYN